VIFQQVVPKEIVHSVKTGEAGCDEQSLQPEKPNGHSPECPTHAL
jgi:hypothetical protein